MTVGRFAWELMLLVLRGRARRRLFFVPMAADGQLRADLQRHAGTGEWMVRAVTAPGTDRFVLALLYVEPTPDELCEKPPTELCNPGPGCGSAARSFAPE